MGGVSHRPVASGRRGGRSFGWFAERAVLWRGSDLCQIGRHLAGPVAVNELFTVRRQSPLGRRAIIRSVTDQQDTGVGRGAGISLPFRAQKVPQLADTGVGIVADQTGPEVAEDDASGCKSPREVQPNNLLGGRQEWLGPAEIPTIGDPGRLFADAPDVGQPCLHGPPAVRLGIVGDVVEVVGGCAGLRAQRLSQRRLATASLAGDEDSARQRRGQGGWRESFHGPPL